MSNELTTITPEQRMKIRLLQKSYQELKAENAQLRGQLAEARDIIHSQASAPQMPMPNIPIPQVNATPNRMDIGIETGQKRPFSDAFFGGLGIGMSNLIFGTLKFVVVMSALLGLLVLISQLFV